MYTYIRSCEQNFEELKLVPRRNKLCYIIANLYSFEIKYFYSIFFKIHRIR